MDGVAGMPLLLSFSFRNEKEVLAGLQRKAKFTSGFVLSKRFMRSSFLEWTPFSFPVLLRPLLL